VPKGLVPKQKTKRFMSDIVIKFCTVGTSDAPERSVKGVALVFKGQ